MFDRFLAGKQSFLHCNNIAKTFFLQAFLKTRTLPSKQSFVCAQQFQAQQLIIIIKKNKNKGTCKTQRDQTDYGISRSTTIAMATLIKFDCFCLCLQEATLKATCVIISQHG